MNMILIEQLRKSFGSIRAVDGISLEIRPGETFGLLGPNGAGKSTTINMMVGLLRPDGGTVQLGELGSPTDPQARRTIGVAPQTVALYDDLTAVENLSFFGRLYGLAGSTLRERVGWCLDFAGLQDRRNGRVRTYSGGMKRRLNMACALLHEPRIVLFDEPTVGVDPQSRNHVFEAIGELKRQGITIVYTTHYMEEAERLCDRIGIMDHGRLLALGTLAELVQSHGGQSVVLGELLLPPPETVRLPGRLDGMSLRFDSAAPLEEIGRLATAGVQFRSLHIDQPDLETVFLALTGRSLRD